MGSVSLSLSLGVSITICREPCRAFFIVGSVALLKGLCQSVGGSGSRSYPVDFVRDRGARGVAAVGRVLVSGDSRRAFAGSVPSLL